VAVVDCPTTTDAVGPEAVTAGPVLNTKVVLEPGIMVVGLGGRAALGSIGHPAVTAGQAMVVAVGV